MLHKFSATHIEAPNKPFLVEFTREAYFNAIWFPRERLQIIAMAMTPAGALRVAQYHWTTTGSDFQVIGEMLCQNPENLTVGEPVLS